MKKKKMAVLLGLGLSLGVLGAVASGAEPVKVDAAGATTTLYFKPNANWKIDDARFAMNQFGSKVKKWEDMTDPDKDGVYQVEFDHVNCDTLIFARMNPKTEVNDWKYKWNQTLDLKFDDPNGCNSGANNYYIYPEGKDVWDKAEGVWSVFGEPEPIMHEVTFDYGYKVAGGTTNYTVVTKVKEGDTVDAPHAMMYGKKAVWDHDFTQPITGEKTITATWVDQTEPMNEIYYVLDANDELPTHLYGFAGFDFSDFGAWPGTPIPEQDITSVLHFNVGNSTVSFQPNEGKIVRVQYPKTVKATNILFNGENNWQTGIKADGKVVKEDQNPVLTNGHTYIGSEDLTGSAQITDAVKLVLDIEDARNAVKGDGVIKDYSICGIASAEAKKFYERYHALDPEIQAYVDKTVTYTYIAEGEGNVSFDAIIAQLGVLGGNVNQPLHFLNTRAGNHAVVYSVVGVISLATIALSAFFLIRRKKQH